MEQVKNMETIVALSTPAAAGAISIVRMSGKNAVQIADKLFVSVKGKKPSEFIPRMLELGTFNTGSFKEHCMCVRFNAPFSYTGENVVEFQLHGGMKITEGVIAACIKAGARMASAGEFTKRAFLNGKMSLASAEGMMDMINAESEAEIRAGYNLLQGELSKLAKTAQDELTDLLSEIEVSFDYPEETIEYVTKNTVKTRLMALYEKINATLQTANTGKLLKNGVGILILGKPNAGKSSLLNALLSFERAIVTDIAGTTRDTIEDTFVIDGTKFNVIDTAGIRDTDDIVEKIGVDKAKSLISGADLVIYVKDGSTPDSAEDKQIQNLLLNKKHIVAINKSDLMGHYDPKENEIVISAKNNVGIQELKNKIYQISTDGYAVSSNIIITNERHKDALSRAAESIMTAITNMEMSLDLISIDLKLAYSALGEITGNTTGEDIIDAIFSKFCLGK
ncbi:MAG: tRNA uridine-5-carboxymethylaminomethyl(34) synthesis GTPase MnmE [Clostridia bacterium]|nr:tRNA uridine-5-carboxymethylaminomethyl(34) synthesis GTPase MnmE [Clostridia bacterium]